MSPQDRRIIERYRAFMAALLFSIIIHGVALLAMAFVLAPGLDFNAHVVERAGAVAAQPWRWRLGWLPWQITALSDLLVSVSLLAYVAVLPARGEQGARPGLVWAGLALLATIAAILPEQWGEAMALTRLVDEAPVAAGGEAAEYLALESKILLTTGTCGNTGYTLMGIFWMLAARALAGGSKGVGLGGFLVLGALTWLLFSACSVVNGYACKSVSPAGDYPGHGALFVLNAAAFPLLCLWMAWMGPVIGAGHHARYPAPDRGLHALTWPKPGLLGKLAPLTNWPGLRDLIRPSGVFAPMPVMASDITDVVYLNWLVPQERVAAMLPPPLEPDVFGQRSFVSLLTYTHGHFGPEFLGPLRRLMPSPAQSNWRFYVCPERPGADRDAIYFFKTSLDDDLLVFGSRLGSDGLPSQRPLRLIHERSGDAWTTEIDPGAGSAPDLKARVRRSSARLPEEMAARFESWEAAVRYLVEQNRGLSSLPAQGRLLESRIAIPIAVEDVIPAALEGVVESAFLSALIEGCECLAFVVPRVSFRALGEGWCGRIETRGGAE